jgi:hypothetical protein
MIADIPIGLPAERKIQSVTGTAGGTNAIDLNSGHNILFTFGAGNSTINFTNPPVAGMCYHIPMRIKQDSTGSRTITAWQVGGSAVTPSGTVTLTATGNAVDRVHAVLWNTSGTYTLDLIPAYMGIE